VCEPLAVVEALHAACEQLNLTQGLATLDNATILRLMPIVREQIKIKTFFEYAFPNDTPPESFGEQLRWVTATAAKLSAESSDIPTLAMMIWVTEDNFRVCELNEYAHTLNTTIYPFEFKNALNMLLIKMQRGRLFATSLLRDVQDYRNEPYGLMCVYGNVLRDQKLFDIHEQPFHMLDNEMLAAVMPAAREMRKIRTLTERFLDPSSRDYEPEQHQAPLREWMDNNPLLVERLNQLVEILNTTNDVTELKDAFDEMYLRLEMVPPFNQTIPMAPELGRGVPVSRPARTEPRI
jgi:hypothetical protein